MTGMLHTELPTTSIARTPTGPWPELPAESWSETLDALHRWMQIVGKIRMANAPWVNHSWSVPLYVGPRGVRTSLVPLGADGVELAFDLLDHELRIESTTGRRRLVPLADGTVADFYGAVVGAMQSIGMPVDVDPRPSELPGAVRFDCDTADRAYDPAHAEAWWRAMLRAERVLARFRAGFAGKASPVHLFWGGLDLATTRFSGRPAPRHPGGMANLPDDIVREAYSHELSSAGFWAGSRTAPEPVFYAYSYPCPEGYGEAQVVPSQARWVDDLGEFVLPYSSVAGLDDPDGAVLMFFETAHVAAAALGRWDPALERVPPFGPDWWSNRRSVR